MILMRDQEVCCGKITGQETDEREEETAKIYQREACCQESQEGREGQGQLADRKAMDAAAGCRNIAELLGTLLG